MVSKYKKVLGLNVNKKLSESDILTSFKKKIKQDPDELVDISDAALKLMKSYSKPRFGLKLNEDLFNYMMDEMCFSQEPPKIFLYLRGFKTISHKGFFSILKKKYGKNNGSVFGQDWCEITFFSILLPNDRSGYQYPSMKIKVTSEIPHLKFEINGDSGCIFVLFHLKQLLATFVKNLPEKVENCYISPKAYKIKPRRKEEVSTDTSSEEEESESSPEKLPPPKAYTASSNEDSCDISEKSPSPVFRSSRKPRRENPTLENAVKTSTPSPETSNPTPKVAKTSKAEVASSKTKPKSSLEKAPTQEVVCNVSQTVPQKNKIYCIDCSLIIITEDIHQLALDNMNIKFECSYKCLECKDSLQDFVIKFRDLICQGRVDYESLPNLRNNMKNVIL